MSIQSRTVNPRVAGQARALSTCAKRLFPVKIRTMGKIAMAGMLPPASDEARPELEHEWRQAKLELLGQMSAGLAHEFNNLLTVVRGRTEVLLSQELLQPGFRDSLLQVLKAADRAVELTSLLEGLSDRPAGPARPFDLNGLLTSMTKWIRHLLGPSIRCQILSAPDLPAIHADRGTIEHVFFHLAAAGRDDLRKGGEWRVEIAPVEEGQSLPAGLASPERPWVCLSARSIPEASMVRATTEAPTSDPSPVHRGSALPALQSVVRALPGLMEVRQDGPQIVRTLWLPALETLRRPAAPAASGPGLRGGAERILLVEADQGLRRFLCLMLQRLGYHVEDEAAPAGALARWDRTQGGFDLLLLGIQEGATELLRELRGRQASLAALLICAESTESLSTRVPLDGRTRMVRKPFSPEMLGQLIRSTLDAEHASLSTSPR